MICLPIWPGPGRLNLILWFHFPQKTSLLWLCYVPDAVDQKKKEWISKFVDIVKFQDRTPAKTKLQNISAWPNQTACHLLLIRVPVVYSGSPHRLHWGGKGNVQSFIGHNVTICKLPLLILMRSNLSVLVFIPKTSWTRLRSVFPRHAGKSVSLRSCWLRKWSSPNCWEVFQKDGSTHCLIHDCIL